jgi:hypothetical protein
MKQKGSFAVSPNQRLWSAISKRTSEESLTKPELKRMSETTMGCLPHRQSPEIGG